MRKISPEEQNAIDVSASKFCKQPPDNQIGDDYNRGKEVGLYNGFKAGYTECAANSVPIEQFRELVEALKKATFDISKPEWRDALIALERAESLLNEPKVNLHNEDD